MEDNDSRSDMLKCAENLGEINIPNKKKVTDSNTFPLRINKETEVQIAALAGSNSLIDAFSLETEGCEIRNQGVKHCAKKTVEDEVADKAEFSGNIRKHIATNLLHYSTSSPCLQLAKHNSPESRIAGKCTSCKNIENPNHLSSTPQTSTVESHQNEELSASVLNTIASSDTSTETESSCSLASDLDSSTDQSTSSEERIVFNVPELHPLRPSRNAGPRTNTNYRSEIQPTQIQLDPLHNITLPTHVEGAFDIFNNFKSYQPTVGSALFSILMTIIFVGILWIVVFTIFGPKGHAIAGIFLSIFILGFLLNTCFIKFYFRLRLFFGMEQLREQTIRAQNLANLDRQREEELRQQRAMEPPPSYSSVIEAPPTYNVAKDMKLQQTDDSNLKSHHVENSSIKPSTMNETCRNCRIKESTILCSTCKANVMSSQK